MTAALSDHRAVAAVYRMAARVMGAELDAETLHALWELDELLPHKGEDPPRGPMFDAGTEAAVVETAVEYCRLFIGPRPVVPAYPDAGDPLARRAVATMGSVLANTGLRPNAGGHLAPQQLALWLAVLAELHVDADICGQAAANPSLQRLSHTAKSPVAAWLQQTLSVVAASARLWPYRPVARAALAALDATRASSPPSPDTPS